MNIASTKTAPSGSTGATIADVTVVGGAGHVGIPLVLAFAEAGLTVNVNDLNEAALATLRSSKYGIKELREMPQIISATSPEAEKIARSDILILCTPHSVYAEADLEGKPVVDVCGFLKNANVVY